MSGTRTKLFEIYTKVGITFGFGISLFNSMNGIDSPFLKKQYIEERKLGENEHRKQRFLITSHFIKSVSFVCSKGALYGATGPLMVPIMAYHSVLDTNDFASHFVLGSKYSDFDDIINAKNRLFY